jgi:hypothetical protein
MTFGKNVLLTTFRPYVTFRSPPPLLGHGKPPITVPDSYWQTAKAPWALQRA